MPIPIIPSAVSAHLTAVQQFFDHHGKTVESMADALVTTFNRGGKLLVCGNGGSACDALHIAGELVGRFVNDRVALPAIALSADSGILTAVGNDYGYDQVFARQVEALGQKGDMLIALSTSGSSPNVVHALEKARARGMFTVLMTGEKGKSKQDSADLLLAVDSTVTARIQEVHILCLHILAELVEAQLFGKP